MIYYWNNGNWCYREELAEYTEKFGELYDVMPEDEFFALPTESYYDE